MMRATACIISSLATSHQDHTMQNAISTLEEECGRVRELHISKSEYSSDTPNSGSSST